MRLAYREGVAAQMKCFLKYAVVLLVAIFIALPCGYFYAERDIARGSQYLEQTNALNMKHL